MDGDIYRFIPRQAPERPRAEAARAPEKRLTPAELVWGAYAWSFAALYEHNTEHHPLVLLLATCGVIVAYTIPILASAGMWWWVVAAFALWPTLSMLGILVDIFIDGW